MAGDISYLRRMRTGQPPHKIVTLGNGGDSFQVAVILLSSDKMLVINEAVQMRYSKTVVKGEEVEDPRDNEKNRARYYNQLLCYESMRNPDDLNEKIADSPEEVGELLDDEDIQRVCEMYNELIVNKAPKLEVLKQEELDQLKKYLEVTPLSDISTVSLVHLKYCHQTLVSESLLTNNGFGSSSINK